MIAFRRFAITLLWLSLFACNKQESLLTVPEIDDPNAPTVDANGYLVGTCRVDTVFALTAVLSQHGSGYHRIDTLVYDYYPDGALRSAQVDSVTDVTYTYTGDEVRSAEYYFAEIDRKVLGTYTYLDHGNTVVIDYPDWYYDRRNLLTRREVDTLTYDAAGRLKHQIRYVEVDYPGVKGMVPDFEHLLEYEDEYLIKYTHTNYDPRTDKKRIIRKTTYFLNDHLPYKNPRYGYYFREQLTSSINKYEYRNIKSVSTNEHGDHSGEGWSKFTYDASRVNEYGYYLGGVALDCQ